MHRGCRSGFFLGLVLAVLAPAVAAGDPGGAVAARSTASLSGFASNGSVGDGPRCTGDCDGDGRVSVGELVSGVNIALGRADVSTCPDMDANADGRVGINELIAAVASNLDGCPCPFDFLDERAGVSEACVFAGRWNSQCGDSGLPATFSVQGDLLGIAIVTGPDSPTLTFFARSDTGREASLIGLMFGEEAVQLGGTIELGEDGRDLRIIPGSDPGVDVEQCPFERYDGVIDRIVSTGEGAVEAAAGDHSGQ